MESYQKNFTEINGEKFEVIDEIDNIPMADSFVKVNKIEGTTGHGEARLYVGAKNKTDFNKFFATSSEKGFFLKNDFLNYLDDAKFEYEQQEQKYRQDISKNWEEYRKQLTSFSDREFFDIHSAIGPQDNARYYIRSEDSIFDYFRKIVLPFISYVSIIKLKNSRAEIFFLFRLSLSYAFNPYYHPAIERAVEKEIEEKNISLTQKEQLVKARIGQGGYRQRLLEESSECIITKVNDERILMASHIKPWSISNDEEKIDYNNGLILTPTYDKLFDRGFISFNDNRTMKVSNWISPINQNKLRIKDGIKVFNLPIEGREKYLEYHRNNIFKK